MPAFVLLARPAHRNAKQPLCWWLPWDAAPPWQWERELGWWWWQWWQQFCSWALAEGPRDPCAHTWATTSTKPRTELKLYFSLPAPHLHAGLSKGSDCPQPITTVLDRPVLEGSRQSSQLLTDRCHKIQYSRGLLWWLNLPHLWHKPYCHTQLSTGSRTRKLFQGSEVRIIQHGSFPHSLKSPVLSSTTAAAGLASQTAVIQLIDVTWERKWRGGGNMVVSWESLSETLFSHPVKEFLSSALFLILQFAFLFLIVIPFLNFANKMCFPFWFLSSSPWQVIRLLIPSLHFPPTPTPT